MEKEGTAQRFEVALELAWKTLKDFLDHEGRIVDPLTPRTVVKEAFAAGILSHGQTWIDMIDQKECSGKDVIHTWKPFINYGLFLNPMGCNTDTTGILKFV